MSKICPFCGSSDFDTYNLVLLKSEWDIVTPAVRIGFRYYSLAEILVKPGFREKAESALLCKQCDHISLVCPYCCQLNLVKYWQAVKCSNCEKKFYSHL